MNYDNAWFGTGSQSEGDDCWYDARDMARDAENRFLVLDELSSGQAKVKMWDVSANPGEALGSFGDSTSISGAPRRIEGSDYEGFIVVMHGGAPPQMISIFVPWEMPVW
jgi:hypothetical protein